MIQNPGSISLEVAESVSGDFNMDGFFDCVDIDALVADIAAGTNTPVYDLTGDGSVDAEDLTQWLAQAGATNLPSGNSYLLGDANLDGLVDGVDFVQWNSNKFTTSAAWCAGDFNADGVVDGLDFVTWNANKFTSADTDNAAVPEPVGSFGILAAVGYLLLRSRRGGER